MELEVLVIDDNIDKREIQALGEELEHESNKESMVSTKINITHLNPVPFLNLGQTNGQFDKLFNHLDEQFLSKKLDMLLCDFNLHVNHKHIAFNIIGHVRERNKCCTIILFTGSPLKELIRLNNNDLARKLSEHILSENQKADVKILEGKLEQLRKEEEQAEELLKIAVKSQIAAIVSRKDYEEKAKYLISKPSSLLWLENELIKNKDVVFNDGNKKLNGRKLGDIAKEVREQTEEGVYFTNEIIKLSLSNIVKLNF